AGACAAWSTRTAKFRGPASPPHGRCGPRNTRRGRTSPRCATRDREWERHADVAPEPAARIELGHAAHVHDVERRVVRRSPGRQRADALVRELAGALPLPAERADEPQPGIQLHDA